MSTAAEAVHLSQPAVSQILARLEAACRARLFERTGRLPIGHAR